MGTMAALFNDITGNSGKTIELPTSTKHSPCAFPTHMSIPGICKKCDQPVSELYQLALSHLLQNVEDYAKVFTDASVRSDGLSALHLFSAHELIGGCLKYRTPHCR
uniref:Uncharacterized protein n=1 Tax=Rhipicephalus microplus TaxID=6941 RepID=A0A6G5AHP0_RHIMP